MSKYYTLYRVLKNNNIIYDNIEDKDNSRACFKALIYYNYNGIYDKFHKIEIKILKDYSGISEYGLYAENIFSKDQIFTHVNNLTKANFKSVIEEKDDHYIITALKDDFVSKSHFRIYLDFIRLLWEKNINQILKYYFNNLNDSNKEFDYFQALEIISIFINGEIKYCGHQLPCCQYIPQYKTIYSAEDIINKCATRLDLDSSFEVYGKGCGGIKPDIIKSFDLSTYDGYVKAFNICQKINTTTNTENSTNE